MKQFDSRIVPSRLRYKSAPSTDQKVAISLNNTVELNNEFDRIRTVSLSELYDEERQSCEIFRPTFQLNYIYDNRYVGTTNYVPFRNNLFLVDPEQTVLNNMSTWYGYPQYYEFDFLRPNVVDQHINYVSKSAYTYNWSYYITYPYNNNDNKILTAELNNQTFFWNVKDGIPFVIKNIQINGDPLISFECVSPHGLTPGESVELSFNYNGNEIFEVYSLGNGLFESDARVFNIYNIGYTGNTPTNPSGNVFNNKKRGRFKRVLYPDILDESRSKYYIREHKVLIGVDDMILNKTGFQQTPFNTKIELFLSSITPDLRTKTAQQNSNNCYTFTTIKDINLQGLLDNQKRPVSELFLTVINKGFSGYFNKPFINGVGLKQGWEFNINETPSSWWDDNNVDSNSNIQTSSYTKTDSSGNTKTFYYNNNLNVGDVIEGDFCEWNDYEQVERVISRYYHKVKYNQDNFKTSNTPTTNENGFYYSPHNGMKIRVFSNYIETGGVENVDQVPFYSYYSPSDQEFRWRDLYTYGYRDELGRGVDFPFVNKSHYPFQEVIFRFFPEGNDSNNFLDGINEPIKPFIDDCE